MLCGPALEVDELVVVIGVVKLVVVIGVVKLVVVIGVVKLVELVVVSVVLTPCATVIVSGLPIWKCT